MPGHSPLQIGAPLDVSNGLRTSLMSLQQEQTAVDSTSGQNHRADIYRVIQDQYVNFPDTHRPHVSFCCYRSMTPGNLSRKTLSAYSRSIWLPYMQFRIRFTGSSTLSHSNCHKTSIQCFLSLSRECSRRFQRSRDARPARTPHR